MKNDWKLILAINSSTGALLGAIFLICLGSELWGPFIPNYMRDLQAGILLIAAYGTLREIGEPARKAMIVDLIPPAHKTQAIGIYWAARCVAVMLAPLVGGLVWVGVNLLAGHSATDATGPGPLVMLLIASLCGGAGVAYYYTRFGLSGEVMQGGG